MRMDTIYEVMMYVSNIYNQEDLPIELRGREEEILYAYQTAKLGYDQNNPYYPILKKGLEKNFELNLKDSFKFRLSQFMKNVRGIKALDVGCGNGQYSKAMVELGFEVTAIDNKETSTKGAYSFIRGTFPKDIVETYDLILMAEFLHLFQNEERIHMMNAALKRLKKGGILVIVENKKSKGLDYRLKKLGGGSLCQVKDKETIDLNEEYYMEVI